MSEVVVIAKRDLRAGEELDGVGGYASYGMIDSTEAARAENLLPMGLSEGCTVVRPVAADRAVTFADVELPEGRLIDALWRRAGRGVQLRSGAWAGERSWAVGARSARGNQE